MVSTRGRLLVLGGNPLHGSDALDSRMGDGGGEEELQGTTAEAFFADDASSKQPLCFILYIPQWNFRCCMLQSSGKVPSILDALGSARALFRLRQPVDLAHIEDGEGAVILVPPRTPRRSGYVVYADAVYVVICYMSITCICLLYVVICYMSVICYISVICLVLGTSSGSIGSVWIYRRAIFGKQNFW